MCTEGEYPGFRNDQRQRHVRFELRCYRRLRLQQRWRKLHRWKRHGPIWHDRNQRVQHWDRLRDYFGYREVARRCTAESQESLRGCAAADELDCPLPLQVQAFDLCTSPCSFAQKRQTRFDAGIVKKTAHRYPVGQFLPT